MIFDVLGTILVTIILIGCIFLYIFSFSLPVILDLFDLYTPSTEFFPYPKSIRIFQGIGLVIIFVSIEHKLKPIFLSFQSPETLTGSVLLGITEVLIAFFIAYIMHLIAVGGILCTILIIFFIWSKLEEKYPHSWFARFEFPNSLIEKFITLIRYFELREIEQEAAGKGAAEDESRKAS